ncbi:HNH endonuclease [Paenibacillus sp. IHBB 10380]|uniref:HNH endonuclease n=1 Tax=Paenibacillus sp. IHBB 10380 TaxID=1566358 RepID=UPI0009E20887|nr:HNH endonuclease [Paenibacillus sp. IHBB 10380]
MERDELIAFIQEHSDDTDFTGGISDENPSSRKMKLVPTNVHKVNHLGGNSLWGDGIR